MKRAALLFGLLLFGARLDAAQVCVTGATPPTGSCASTYTTIPLAVAAAVDGDVIFLHAGTTYTLHYTLPDKNMSTGILIRTDAADANLPALGVRITRAFSAYLPKLKSDTNTDPVFKTADGADHYSFRGLEFMNAPRGENSILQFGGNECAGSYCQEFRSQKASAISLRHILFTIDPLIGQKVGIEFAADGFTIEDSSLEGFAGLGQDAMPLHSANGGSNYTARNNSMSGAGYSGGMVGGDDAREMTVMIVTGTPTTTGASVSVSAGPLGSTHTLAELIIGDHIAVLGADGTRYHTTLRTVTGSGTSGSITYDQIAGLPAVPGDIRRSGVLTGVLFERNYVFKPLAWLNPILGSPTNVSAVASAGGGTLPAGSYQYQVQAYDNASYGGNTIYGSPVSVSATLSAVGNVTLTWVGVTGATHYRVYGRTSAGVTMFWNVTAPTVTMVDGGTAGTSGTSVTAASYWQLKNLLEFKNAQDVLVRANVFQRQWAGSDIGYGIWAAKTVNQYGRGMGAWSKNIKYEYNIVSSVDGCFEISGTESLFVGNVAGDKPAPLTNFEWSNNLCYDSGTQWHLSRGGQVSSGTYAMNIANGTVGTIIRHNTFIHTSRGLITMDGAKNVNFLFTDNLGLKNTYGIFGSNGSDGNVSLGLYTTNPIVTKNAIAGITTGNYPAGNYGPSVATWESQFNNLSYTGAANANGPADFSLRSDSLYHLAGTDGLDLGADIPGILAATAGVADGTSSGTILPPSFSTTSLPSGTAGTPYTPTVSATGTGSISYAVTSGSLPPGVSLSGAGVFSGTASTAGTYTFTVTATDATTALTAAQAFTVTIAPAFVNVTITSSSLPSGTVGTSYAATLFTANGQGPFTFDLASGSLPAGLTLSSTGLISGVPTAAGSSTPTFRVTGTLGTPATRAIGITIANSSVSSSQSVPTTRPSVFNLFEYGTFRRVTCPADAAKGDTCADLSGPKAVLKIKPSASGDWEQVAATDNSHMMLSATHTDVQPDTAQEGDLLSYQGGKWRRVPDAVGCFYSDGAGGKSYVPCGGGQSSVQHFSSSVTLVTRSASSVAWTDFPSVKGEFNATNGNHGTIDATGFAQAYFSLKVYTAGQTGSIVWIEYSTDETTWQALDSAGATTLPIDGTTSGVLGSRNSPLFFMASGATGRIFLRIVGSGGNDVIDPTFGNVSVVFVK